MRVSQRLGGLISVTAAEGASAVVVISGGGEERSFPAGLSGIFGTLPDFETNGEKFHHFGVELLWYAAAQCDFTETQNV